MLEFMGDLETLGPSHPEIPRPAGRGAVFAQDPLYNRQATKSKRLEDRSGQALFKAGRLGYG
jgi:hypothetical protein